MSLGQPARVVCSFYTLSGALSALVSSLITAGYTVGAVVQR